MHHLMKLPAGPFDRIKSGSKIIELRLYDEKHKLIKIGDTIEFQREPEKMEKLKVEVTALLNYKTFTDLINDFPTDYFGNTDKGALIQNVHRFYTEDEEKEYTVLGIKIKLI